MRATRTFRAAMLAGVLMTLQAGAGAPASGQTPGVPPVMVPPPASGAAGAKGAPKKPAPEKPAPPATAEMTPKTWKLSIYSFEGRVETGVSDITFEAPPAYQESFAFWTGRMKGTSRTELIQHITTTREPGEDGMLPFRRQVSRYLIDVNEHGQIKAAKGELMKDMLTLAWEGNLDGRGNLAGLKRVAGPEDMQAVERLSFPLLDHLFPRLEGPRTIATGAAFTEERTMPLPSKLSIKGLEEMAARMTRRYTLREVKGREAIFDVAVIYAADPSTPPTAERTTCSITGGGDGEAVFDLQDGVFIRARQATSIILDVEAPLRRLPDQPEGSDPGTAKTHMQVLLSLSGKQTVTRLFEDVPPVDAAPAEPTPAESAPAAPAPGEPPPEAPEPGSD